MQLRLMQDAQVLRRVHDFLSAHDVTAAMGPVAAQVAALGALIARVGEHAVQQDSLDRSALATSVVKGRLARELRREYLRPIAHVARTYFPNDQEMQRALALPAFRDNERLLNAARAVAERVSEHAAAFVALGFAPDFVERLKAAVQAFEEAIDSRAADVGGRAAATEGLRVEVRRGKQVVRLLDLMVAPRLASTPSLAAEWRSVSRFRRGSAKGAVEEAVPDAGTGARVAPVEEGAVLKVA